MAKQKFKSAATGGRFKQRGQGLRAAEERIKEQRRTEIEGIKLAQLQHKEISSNFISGIDNAQRFELGVLDEKQKLENKVRQHKYDALSKLAETDVKRLEDEAKAKQKTADWWADFAPKFAKNLGTLATGTLQFADAYRGQKQWEALKASGILDEITDQKEEVNNLIFGRITKDGHSGDPDENNTLHDKTWKVSTHWASKRLAQWYKENKALVRSDVIASWEARAGKGTYGESNAVEVHKFNAHQLLTQLGISPTSQGGKEILEMSTQLGREDQKTFANIRKSEETATRINLQLKDLKGLKVGSDEFKIAFDELVNLHKHGYFKTDKGVSTPYDNPRSVADGLELAYTAYIDSNLKNLDEGKLNEVLATIIPDTHGEHVAFKDKHPVRSERLVEYFRKKKKQQIEGLKSKKESEGLAEYTALETDFNNEVWKTTKEGEQPIDYSTWRLQKIDEISKNKKYTDTTRSLAYNLLAFDPKNHDIAGAYTYISRELKNGNYAEAAAKYHTLSADEQRAMNKEFKVFTDIENSGYTYKKKSGMAAVYAKNEGLIKQEQTGAFFGGNDPGSNALEKLDQINEAWVNKFEYWQGEGKSDKVAAQLADDYIAAEWKAGKDDETGKHWLHRSEPTKPGEKVEFTDLKDTNTIALENAKAVDDLRKAEIDHMVMSEDTVEHLITNQDQHEKIPGYDGNPLSLFKSKEFVTDKSLNTLLGQIENAQKNKTKGGDFNIPNNIHKFQEIYRNNDGHQVPMHRLLEKIFEQRDIDIKIPAGSDAATSIMNDQRGFKSYNQTAVKYYQAHIASTGKLPIKKHIRKYLTTNPDDTPDTNYTVLDLFSDSTGISWEQGEDGRYQFSDRDGMLRNGGLDLPLNMTPTEMLDMFGFRKAVSLELQTIKPRSITNWGGY